MFRVVLLTCHLFLLGGCTLLRPPCAPSRQDDAAASGPAACAVLHAGELLVIRHLYSGKLDLPGGRPKPGESPACTAQRETWEETGLDVRVLDALPGLPSVYRCTLADPTRAGVAPDLRWWSRGEVRTVLWVDPWALSPEDWRWGERLQTLKQALADGG
jgi:8-oxo-dGTP pyrophosphatase MutT (NUDIX family)